MAPQLAGRADTDQPLAAAADGVVRLVIELSNETVGPVWAVAAMVGHLARHPPSGHGLAH